MKKKIVFHNNLDEVNNISALIEEIGEQLDLSFAMVSSIQLAIEEAVVNVIHYAYPKDEIGEASLTVTREDEDLVFELLDSGHPFDPTAKKDPDITLPVEERPIGGLGILLVKKIMNAVSYERKEGHNILRMVKHLK